MWRLLLLVLISVALGGTELEKARDAQDRAALERIAGQLSAAAQKQPNDDGAQYKLALADSYVAEVAIELRDKNQAHSAAEAGMITGVLLAIARISGETAPLLFTSLNNQFWSTDLNAPMASLPAVIFQFALSPYKDWQQLAWTGALIITFTVLVLSIIARALAVARKQS